MFCKKCGNSTNIIQTSQSVDKMQDMQKTGTFLFLKQMTLNLYTILF